MSITYNKYFDRRDHCWYDSSNIVYSEFFDNYGNSSLKIVFKGGRTYLYRDVDPNVYMLFKHAESNGEAFNKYIRKYPTTKQDDTSLDSLETMKNKFIEMDNDTSMNLALRLNDKTGAFIIERNGMKVFEGVEGEVSIMNLLNSLHLPYTCEVDDNVKLTTLVEFENKPII